MKFLISNDELDETTEELLNLDNTTKNLLPLDELTELTI